MTDRKKLCERYTVCLDEDDVRGLELLLRDDAARHNGRWSNASVVIRELVRERIATVRDQITPGDTDQGRRVENSLGK